MYIGERCASANWALALTLEMYMMANRHVAEAYCPGPVATKVRWTGLDQTGPEICPELCCLKLLFVS